MANFTININGKDQKIETTEDAHLLWIIREHLGMMGTKFSCGIGACGACTVLVDMHSTEFPLPEKQYLMNLASHQISYLSHIIY